MVRSSLRFRGEEGYGEEDDDDDDLDAARYCSCVRLTVFSDNRDLLCRDVHLRV